MSFGYCEDCYQELIAKNIELQSQILIVKEALSNEVIYKKTGDELKDICMEEVKRQIDRYRNEVLRLFKDKQVYRKASVVNPAISINENREILGLKRIK